MFVFQVHGGETLFRKINKAAGEFPVLQSIQQGSLIHFRYNSDPPGKERLGVFVKLDTVSSVVSIMQDGALNGPKDNLLSGGSTSFSIGGIEILGTASTGGKLELVLKDGRKVAGTFVASSPKNEGGRSFLNSRITLELKAGSNIEKMQLSEVVEIKIAEKWPKNLREF